MLSTTLPRLRCPVCLGELSLREGSEARGREVVSGDLRCGKCKASFPILAGVAVLVPDVGQYLLDHAKGIGQHVPDAQIPKAFRRDYLAAKAEIASMGAEHIEEDLESERVIALYLMNHFLSVKGSPEEWWKPAAGSASPLIDQLVREHWDKGPLPTIASWVAKLEGVSSVVELGCGLGGLSRMIHAPGRSYLGVDSSFASVALGRHLALGAPFQGKTRIPNDLLQGPLAREVRIAPGKDIDGLVDLVVGEIEALPLPRGVFDLSLALNAIDMLPEPETLPKLQSLVLKPGGIAIQSCPYIWHEGVVRKLRAWLPKTARDSASAVEWLYEKAGLKIQERIDHLPWLFYKHARQLEIYSVHLFRAKKKA